jgi:hypothetical protein
MFKLEKCPDLEKSSNLKILHKKISYLKNGSDFGKKKC